MRTKRHVVRLTLTALALAAAARSQELPTAPAGDTCSAAQPLVLSSPADGTLAGASADYGLSGSACFSGLGNTASAAAGRDVVYSFRAPSSGRFSFLIRHAAALNPVLTLASSCPAAPATLGDCIEAANRRPNVAAGGESVACRELSAGQQVYVYVDEDSLGSGGDFRLEIERCMREGEPNETPAQAPFTAEPRTGSIGSAGDVDFFYVGTPSPGARMFAIVDGSAGGSTDFDLRVTTATDTLEYDDLDNDARFGSLAPNVAGTPMTTGPSYLRVSQFNPTAQAEPYVLYYVWQPPASSATAESEPNGTIASADASFRGYFSAALAGPAPSSDVDVFRIQADAGALIHAALDGDPARDGTPVDARLELLDSAGTVLVSVNGGVGGSNTTPSPGTLAGTTPSSPGEGLLYRVPAGRRGSYYARVSIATASTTGLGAGDYLLSVTQRPAFFKGDLDRDGREDLLFRHSASGQTNAWLMNGRVQLSVAAIAPTPANLAQQIVGADDFDGDLQNDLVLWSSTSGQVEFWRLSGTQRQGSPVPLTGAAPLPLDWKLSATGDFDFDGKPDIVWRNSVSQKIEVWTMNGTVRAGVVVPTPDQAANANWEIVAALDYNRDGVRDLLWYNRTSGRIVQWLMDSALVRSAGRFTNPPSAGNANWKVLAGGEYRWGPSGGGPGDNDAVWRNATSGKLVVWYLDSSGNRTDGEFTVPDAPSPDPLTWLLVGPR